MAIMHGLTVLLLIFEGIINQCEGNPNPAGSSRNSKDNSSIEVSSATFDSLGLISGKEECFQTRIVVIGAYRFRGEIKETRQGDDIFFEFGDYQSVKSFFEKFGSDVRKIQIDYTAITEKSLSINWPNFIKQCVQNLDELRISCNDDKDFWDKLGKDIIFPNVKIFHFSGSSSRDTFKLKKIFRKLESVRLSGTIRDKNCFLYVKTLKELELFTQSIDENELGSILTSNKNIRKLALTKPKEEETIRLIAENLKELVILNVTYPGGHFLFRKSSRNLYTHTLLSVTDFIIKIDNFSKLLRSLSFDMPNLKRLTLDLGILDAPIPKFIENFKELIRIELIIRNASAENISNFVKSISLRWIPVNLGRDIDGARHIMFTRLFPTLECRIM